MLKRSTLQFTTRSRGYVFWRESTCQELDSVKKSYLAQTNFIPIAEIARRMVRIKNKYESTQDIHERTLLRGEYKYFSGKLCSINTSRNSDCVAYLNCASFFGFWDTAQIEQIMLLLRRRLTSLTANELYLIFVNLSGLRKEMDDLYSEVAHRLANHICELTVEECVNVSIACELNYVPFTLLQNLFRVLEKNVKHLTPNQAIQLLDHLSAAPHKIQMAFSEMYEAIVDYIQEIFATLEKSDDLCEPGRVVDAIDTATAFYALTANNFQDQQENVNLLQHILNYFIDIEYNCDAHSLAMIFAGLTSLYKSNTCNSLSIKLIFQATEHLEKRVLFLSTDFTTTELLTIYNVYFKCLTEIKLLSISHKCKAIHASTVEESQNISSLSPEHTLSEQINQCEQKKVNQCDQLILQNKVAWELEQQYVAMLERKQTHLKDSLEVLTEQLINILRNPSAQIFQADLFSVLVMLSEFHSNIEMYCKESYSPRKSYEQVNETVLSAVKTENCEKHEDLCINEKLLEELIPEISHILEHVANKIIARISHWSISVMLDILIIGNKLGSKFIKDALITCILAELTKRLDKATCEQLQLIKAVLLLQSNLREEHQRRIYNIILPAIERSQKYESEYFETKDE